MQPKSQDFHFLLRKNRKEYFIDNSLKDTKSNVHYIKTKLYFDVNFAQNKDCLQRTELRSVKTQLRSKKTQLL